MQICPAHSHERKDIKDWDVFDYLNALHNEADRYEFNGDEKISKAFNQFAKALLEKEVKDYNKRQKTKEGKSYNENESYKDKLFGQLVGHESYKEWEHECDIDASVH